MLKLLRRLLGTGSSRGARARRSAPPTSATAAVLGRRGADAAPESAATVEFDPYNTGAFDRSASWERVGKRGF